MFGWLALVVLLGAVGTSGYYRRRARLASETIPRRREGALFLARAPVALLLVGPVIAYAVSPRWMAWASFAVPEWLRWLGFVVGLLTILSVSWVLRSLGQNVSETVLTKQRHELVVAGPYRWVRHPLYATGITLVVAVGLMNASWFILFMAAVTTVLMLLVVIPIEERHLLAKFGERYRAYAERTGRLLPRVGTSNVDGT